MVGVKLDFTITPQLKREGLVRELMRAVQDARKEEGLNPQDRINLYVDGTTRDLIIGFEKELSAVVGADEIAVRDTSREVIADEEVLRFSIVKL
jgi:isoleucyl-tRNA synthetase